MISHQIFETWILQEDPINEEETQLLDIHLLDCEQCRQLKNGWQSASQNLRTVTQVQPAKGFSQRWQAGLAERRIRAQQKQTRRFFVFTIGITFLSYMGLIATFLLGTSPIELLSTLLRNTISLFLVAKQIQNILMVTLNSVPVYVPVVLWILVSTGFCLAVFVGGGVMWKYYFKGAFTK